MKLSLHMDFACSLLPPIRRGGIWKQIIKSLFDFVNLSSPNTRISIRALFTVINLLDPDQKATATRFCIHLERAAGGEARV
jgi:hypothetical protein